QRYRYLNAPQRAPTRPNAGSGWAKPCWTRPASWAARPTALPLPQRPAACPDAAERRQWLGKTMLDTAGFM
ncbi:hypothetical protein, partial [Hymenobacter coccineus]|uniref:hypothetical protein n=1 Tax=Hymenobacter coccineus TaxID=1908235 RepID=UPI001955E2F6